MSTRRLALALVALMLAAGCKRDWIFIPSPPHELVVHGVLNPSRTMQFVLIERTLTGEQGTLVGNPLFNPTEPIVTDAGIPERGATTQITGPDGTVYPGSEVSACFMVPPNQCNGSGAGVYKFFIAGSSLVRGGTYSFMAVTTGGDTITAETVVPETPLNTTTTSVTFNRSRDTLALAWGDSPRAPAYQIHVTNPYLGWTSFTDSTRVALTGALRNPDDARLARVFLPGFRQRVTVTAVDANVFDYYRTSNNSFVGFGNVSRVKGALGVFGSVVNVASHLVTVTADQTAPIEGRWRAVDAGLGYVYFTGSLNLYIESAATKKGEAAFITGSYSASGNCTGTFKDGRLQLELAASPINEILDVELRGDTLVGHYRLGAPAKFVRVP